MHGAWSIRVLNISLSLYPARSIPNLTRLQKKIKLDSQSNVTRLWCLTL